MSTTPKQAIMNALQNCSPDPEFLWEEEADEVLYELGEAGYAVVETASGEYLESAGAGLSPQYREVYEALRKAKDDRR